VISETVAAAIVAINQIEIFIASGLRSPFWNFLVDLNQESRHHFAVQSPNRISLSFTVLELQKNSGLEGCFYPSLKHARVAIIYRNQYKRTSVYAIV
jgi:hypothetical protein